jgi:FkbM family methyltransferase
VSTKSFRQILEGIPLIRKSVLCGLKLCKRDLWISNPWTGDPLRINLYHHKGYWYFKRDREIDTMQYFSRLIRSEDTVIEIGGHVGFITQYFSKLVGPSGKVVVFEPGSNNIPYIERNVRCLRNATLERAAVSSTNGKATLYEDDITGQNNSLIRDYKVADLVAKSHGQKLIRNAREVDTVTLDSYVSDHGLTPDFLKIDVEGFEFQVLLGASKTLRGVRALMVEVTEQKESVTNLLRNAGFRIFDEHEKEHAEIAISGNVFAVH